MFKFRVQLWNTGALSRHVEVFCAMPPNLFVRCGVLRYCVPNSLRKIARTF